MADGNMAITYNSETGTWEEYDGTYDVTIHCTSKEKSDHVANLMLIANQISSSGMWTPASKLPPLHQATEDDDYPLKYEISERLLVYTENGRIIANVRYVISESFVGWDDWSGGLAHTKVTHWMIQPKPPKETKHG